MTNRHITLYISWHFIHPIEIEKNYFHLHSFDDIKYVCTLFMSIFEAFW